jgi:hypothetical protein
VLKSLQLQLLIGPAIPLPAPAQLVDALESAQVNTGVGQPSGFQLTFAVSKQSVITQTLLPAGALDPGIRVILVVVVAGMPHVLSDGIITRQELSPSDTPGGSKLTLTGEDLSVLFNVVEWRIPYPGLPSAARVAGICAKYSAFGIIPIPVPPVMFEVPLPVERFPMQHGITDLEYIQMLADQAGHVFFMETGPVPGMNFAYWGPEVHFGPPMPALSYNLGTASNVESLSFSYDGTSSTHHLVDITIPFTKASIPIPVPDVGLLRPPLAARPAMKLQWKYARNTSNLNAVAATLYGLSKTTRSTSAISGQGKLDVLRYGTVLKPRRVVGVRGVGLAYDGLYFVKSVTHELKRGEYKQSFSLSRDGLLPITPRVIP